MFTLKSIHKKTRSEQFTYLGDKFTIIYPVDFVEKLNMNCETANSLLADGFYAVITDCGTQLPMLNVSHEHYIINEKGQTVKAMQEPKQFARFVKENGKPKFVVKPIDNDSK